MKTLLRSFLILPSAFFLCIACETTGSSSATSVASKAATFAQSDAGKALGNTLLNVAANAGAQYAINGNIDPQQLVGATLYGSAAEMRTLVNTPRQSAPGAIASAVTIGSGVRAFDNTVSPIVAAQVSRQIQSGVPPHQAIENVATVMDHAAAKATRSSGAP
jgi:hypothetical protein